jgi:hypothetical protein
MIVSDVQRPRQIRTQSRVNNCIRLHYGWLIAFSQLLLFLCSVGWTQRETKDKRRVAQPILPSHHQHTRVIMQRFNQTNRQHDTLTRKQLKRTHAPVRRRDGGRHARHSGLKADRSRLEKLCETIESTEVVCAIRSCVRSFLCASPAMTLTTTRSPHDSDPMAAADDDCPPLTIGRHPYPCTTPVIDFDLHTPINIYGSDQHIEIETITSPHILQPNDTDDRYAWHEATPIDCAPKETEDFRQSRDESIRV